MIIHQDSLLLYEFILHTNVRPIIRLTRMHFTKKKQTNILLVTSDDVGLSQNWIRQRRQHHPSGPV